MLYAFGFERVAVMVGDLYFVQDGHHRVSVARAMGDKDINGSLFIGDKGMVTTGCYGERTRLVPESKMKDYKKPDPTLPRIPDQNHAQNWLDACKGGEPSCSNFDYAGPFTEMVNFGNLTVKSGKKLKWDNVKGVVTNVRHASDIVSKEYRKGWELPIPDASI